MVVDGATALVVDAEDVMGFAAAFDRLAGDPELRRTFGQAGRERAVAALDLDRLADRLLPHYLDLAGVP